MYYQSGKSIVPNGTEKVGDPEINSEARNSQGLYNDSRITFVNDSDNVGTNHNSDTSLKSKKIWLRAFASPHSFDLTPLVTNLDNGKSVTRGVFSKKPPPRPNQAPDNPQHSLEWSAITYEVEISPSIAKALPKRRRFVERLREGIRTSLEYCVHVVYQRFDWLRRFVHG